ncbi:hypothetical protein NHQ30_005463 [Ciborinia camelliae]|nr:hypothetical protein NHQ30_005463 [Ciborinia camelliae]
MDKSSPQRDAKVSDPTDCSNTLVCFENKNSEVLKAGEMNCSNLLESLMNGYSESLAQKKREELLDDTLALCCVCIKDALRKPQDESKEALVSVWVIFTNTAQNIEWNDPFHDRLICLLLWTKEFDVLRRTLRPEEMKTRCSWECYHLVKVVQKSWKQLLFSNHDTIAKQCNLASFTATALAIGTHDWLGITALWYLRESLEMTDKRTVSLAPVTIIWIRTAGAKLLTFSILKKKWKNQDNDNDALNVEWLQTPGLLAKVAGVTEQGFSLRRWLFWKGRFERFAQDECDEEMRAWATDTFEYMAEFDSMMTPEITKSDCRDEAKTESLREKGEKREQKTGISRGDENNNGEQKVDTDSGRDDQRSLVKMMNLEIRNKR